ncbi:MAG: response regulator [Chitinophagaceae bacterium]|nr:response regulator [Chitinophagaceae bacterium]MBL0337475.1 response regulator [Chitinophagaceae bacterium]
MKNILLIEDNEDVRANTAEILELSNYHVVTAQNGKEGVEKALAEKPDLIICDIMMPVLDGYGVLHAIHKNETIKNTPFIFLTARAEKNDFRKGMELGADDYITKPFSGTELLNAVESRIKKHEMLEQEFSPGLAGMDQLLETTSAQHALETLTEGRNINKFRKKQIIYSEGNHPNKLYYILKGKVKVYKTNDEGKELVTDLYSPGDFLGHVALLEGTVYKDTAETLEETELAVIPKEDFDELLNSNPNVARKFIKLLAKNITDKEEHLLGLAYNSLRKKVAEALLTLQKKYKQKPEEKFVISINRESLSSIAGTATESLIRTLGDFRNEKLIDIREGKIIILNYQKLNSLRN